jgi:alkanesulfonate monooxygenase
MEFGLHIADFTWTGGAPALGPALARHVREAEAAGIRRISVMDHFWQIRGVGPAEHEMLEAYSALGFIVAHTERALLHTLVTGVIYREPALLAKAVTTLDVLSGGRVGLGIGAAWNEDESRGLGFEFPPVAERLRSLRRRSGSACRCGRIPKNHSTVSTTSSAARSTRRGAWHGRTRT